MMRKLLSYILIATFVTSLFDVVDVNDICLGDEIIFSTADTAADNPDDALDDDSYHYKQLQLFLPGGAQGKEVFAVSGRENHCFPEAWRLPPRPAGRNLYRPPIA